MPRARRLSDIPDRITHGALRELFGDLEHERLDFKVRPDNLTEVIPAMAMTDGGFVVLGIRNNRELAGCALNQATLDRVSRAGHECGVSVQVRETEVDGTLLTVVAVPEVRGRITTTPDGRLLRRIGSHNQPLVGDSLARFVRERQNQSAEDDPVVLADLGDLELELVNRALVADGKGRTRRDSLMRALIDLGVALPSAPPADPTLTKAAVLLFGSDPRSTIPGASVQLVRRAGVGPGPGPTVERAEVYGPIPRVLDEVMVFVEEHTSRYEAVIGTRREMLAEYPTSVLREAVLNALAHRDYGLSGATVDVTIWDDRIEIHSPGPLPGHITLENIRQEHYSRNRRVMRVLKLLGLVEEYGEGVDRMFDEMESRLMDPPAFSATPSSVTVTLRNRSLVTLEDQAWLALLGHLELSPSERRLLVIARHEDGVTPRRARQVMPEAEVEALLAGVVAKGLLVRTGERGGTRYVLSDEVIVRAGSAGVEARSRQRQMLVDEIHRRGSLSTAEAVEFLQEDDVAMVRHLLNDLVRARLASARGRTRARRYHPT